MQDTCRVIWRLEWPDPGENGHQVRISVYRISNLVLMSYPQAGGHAGNQVRISNRLQALKLFRVFTNSTASGRLGWILLCWKPRGSNQFHFDMILVLIYINHSLISLTLFILSDIFHAWSWDACSDIWRFDRPDSGGEEPGSNIEPGGYWFDIRYWWSRVQNPQNHPPALFQPADGAFFFGISSVCRGSSDSE